LVARAGDMRGDQDSRISPEPYHRRPLEFADIDVERSASKMTALQRVKERILIDDLAPGDVDQHAAYLHRGKAVLVEQTSRLWRPLTADHHEIAMGQKVVEIGCAAKPTKSWR